MFGNLEPGRSKRLTASGLVLTASGQAILSGILVATGTPTITVYDGTDTTGEVIVNGLVAVAGTPYPIPRIINKGIYVVLSGAGDITVFYN